MMTEKKKRRCRRAIDRWTELIAAYEKLLPDLDKEEDRKKVADKLEKAKVSLKQSKL